MKNKKKSQNEYNRYDLKIEEPHEFKTQEEAFQRVFDVIRYSPASIAELERAGIMRETIAHFTAIGLINEKNGMISLTYSGLGYFETKRFFEQTAQKKSKKDFWKNAVSNFVVSSLALLLVELILMLF